MIPWLVLLAPDAWLDGLQARVAADVARGGALVVKAHVPLCDNAIIRCGGHGLGDGNDPDRNLYWATSGGFRGWLGRKGSGWTLVLTEKPGGDVAERRVWRRRVVPGAEWRRRGVTRPFLVILDVTAWRGSKIDAAVAAYARDLYGDGDAHVVAWVGHNRWMDYPSFAWPADAASRPKGMIAHGCRTEPYFRGVPGPTRVPLLLTTDLLFAGAHAFAGAIEAFADGAGYAAIRERAVQSYATGQKKAAAMVRYAFTNPSRSR